LEITSPRWTTNPQPRMWKASSWVPCLSPSSHAAHQPHMNCTALRIWWDALSFFPQEFSVSSLSKMSHLITCLPPSSQTIKLNSLKVFWALQKEDARMKFIESWNIKGCYTKYLKPCSHFKLMQMCCWRWFCFLLLSTLIF
jgi:hypothetical protein